MKGKGELKDFFDDYHPHPLYPPLSFKGEGGNKKRGAGDEIEILEVNGLTLTVRQKSL